MKFVIIATLACAALVAATPTLTSYNDFGNIIETMSGSAEKTDAFLACFTSKGPCTDDATYFKSVVPDIVKTGCSKCTDLQKVQVRTVLADCHKYFPELSKGLQAQLDPEDKLFPALHLVIDHAKV